MHPNDAITAAREGTLAGRSPEVLGDMLKSVVCYQANNPHDVQAAYSIMAIRGELESREALARNQAVIAEQQRLKGSVDTLVSGQSVLKGSVDQLQKARCVDKAILIAGAIAALAGVILLVLEFVRGSGGGK
jgi:hypothetical protein